jgi:hypothetical protein
MTDGAGMLKGKKALLLSWKKVFFHPQVRNGEFDVLFSNKVKALFRIEGDGGFSCFKPEGLKADVAEVKKEIVEEFCAKTLSLIVFVNGHLSDLSVGLAFRMDNGADH